MGRTAHRAVCPGFAAWLTVASLSLLVHTATAVTAHKILTGEDDGCSGYRGSTCDECTDGRVSPCPNVCRGGNCPHSCGFDCVRPWSAAQHRRADAQEVCCSVDPMVNAPRGIWCDEGCDHACDSWTGLGECDESCDHSCDQCTFYNCHCGESCDDSCDDWAGLGDCDHGCDDGCVICPGGATCSATCTCVPTGYPTGYPRPSAFPTETGWPTRAPPPPVDPPGADCIDLGDNCWRTRRADSFGNYGNNDACTIDVPSGVGDVHLQVLRFSTEGLWDVLVVNGNSYSGSGPPNNILVTSLSWRSDNSLPRTGWHICLRTQNGQPLPPAPTSSPTDPALPTLLPRPPPTIAPTSGPTAPTAQPTTADPTLSPRPSPTTAPTSGPTVPTAWPTEHPTGHPSGLPTTGYPAPSGFPSTGFPSTGFPSGPSRSPTGFPSGPTASPTGFPSSAPGPSGYPTGFPSSGFPSTGFPSSAYPTQGTPAGPDPVQLRSCNASSATYTVDGITRSSPCSRSSSTRDVDYVDAYGTTARLYTCSKGSGHHFVLCTCSGATCASNEEPSTCFRPSNRTLGCGGTLRGAVFSSDGTKAFVACNKEVRVCKVNLSSRDGQWYSDCQVLDNVGCPSWAALRGIAARPRGTRGDLLTVVCTDSKTRACSLDTDNMKMEAGRQCVNGRKSLCKGIGNPTAITFSSANRLIAACGSGYTYSKFVGGIVKDPVSHIAYNGSAPCPAETKAIVELGSGRAVVACGPNVIRECQLRYP